MNGGALDFNTFTAATIGGLSGTGNRDPANTQARARRWR
jgi:hypothetical protein